MQEWQESELPFHVMRDHFYHTEPMMGGMWGVKLTERKVRDQCEEAWARASKDTKLFRAGRKTKGPDQNMLGKYVLTVGQRPKVNYRLYSIARMQVWCLLDSVRLTGFRAEICGFLQIMCLY